MAVEYPESGAKFVRSTGLQAVIGVTELVRFGETWTEGQPAMKPSTGTRVSLVGHARLL